MLAASSYGVATTWPLVNGLAEDEDSQFNLAAVSCLRFRCSR